MVLKLRNKLIGSILIPIAAIFFIALGVIGYLWVQSEYRALEIDNNNYAADYIESRKAELRSEVMRAIEIITDERSKAERQLQLELKEHVYQAYNVITSLNQHYTGSLTVAAIQQKALEALRYQRWDDGQRYFYIATRDGIEKLYPPNPALENRPITEIFGKAGRNALQQMNDTLHKGNEGPVAYQWRGTDLTAPLQTKHSYIKLFEPWNWVIGTGDYSSNFEQALRKQVYQRISQLSHIRNKAGYFFITSYTGDVHVSRHQYFPEPSSQLNALNSEGIPVVQRNIQMARQHPEGGFTRYRWLTADDEQGEKISFVKGIDPWHILIGTGVYLNEMQQEINKRKARLTQQLRNRIQSVLMIIGVALLIIGIAIYGLVLKLRTTMQLFQQMFSDSINSRVHIDINHIYFDEFKLLAHQANTMIDGLNEQTKELRHRAYHDHLTGLPNRMYGTRYLSETIEQARGHQGRVALLFIDLDNFKEVNDTLGHSEGDLLLKMVASRLQSIACHDDMVARLGGDEFTIITNIAQNPERLPQLAEQILALFSDPFMLSSQSMYCTASIGLSTYPENGNTAELLLRNADSAMYRAKGEGKNGYSLYNSTMTDEVVNRVATIEALREAIEHQQFVLYFQPQIDISNGQVIGAEALIRWLHPEKGLLPPGAFIACAEASGQIAAIGEWVMREACRKCVQWRDSGIDVPRIAINISGHQLKGTSLASTLKSILNATGCPASALELEVTESVLMDNPERSATMLEALQTLGAEIAIDDFGTGYSSLSYLKRLPINKLKIDRSFIDELHLDGHDQAITRAIIALAQSLKLEVIAEGVENIEQLNRLRELGCNQVQGFHFSRPLPEPEFLAYIEDAGAELMHEDILLDFY